MKIEKGDYVIVSTDAEVPDGGEGGRVLTDLIGRKSIGIVTYAGGSYAAEFLHGGSVYQLLFHFWELEHADIEAITFHNNIAHEFIYQVERVGDLTDVLRLIRAAAAGATPPETFMPNMPAIDRAREWMRNQLRQCYTLAHDQLK